MQSTSTSSQKNACSVLHLRSWLLKKIQNAIKTWVLLSFTSLCNFIIVSSINFERILILASAGSPPLLLSQLFRSSVSASQHPTTDAARKKRGGGRTGVGEGPGGHTQHRGPPTEEPLLSQGSYSNLQCPKICPNTLTSKETQTQKLQRTRLCQGLTEVYPNSDQILGMQAHCHLPGRR